MNHANPIKLVCYVHGNAYASYNTVSKRHELVWFIKKIIAADDMIVAKHSGASNG